MVTCIFTLFCFVFSIHDLQQRFRQILVRQSQPGRIAEKHVRHFQWQPIVEVICPSANDDTLLQCFLSVFRFHMI